MTNIVELRKLVLAAVQLRPQLLLSLPPLQLTITSPPPLLLLLLLQWQQKERPVRRLLGGGGGRSGGGGGGIGVEKREFNCAESWTFKVSEERGKENESRGN